MVKVLPLPVCPYAKQLLLKPDSALSTSGRPTTRKKSACGRSIKPQAGAGHISTQRGGELATMALLGHDPRLGADLLGGGPCHEVEFVLLALRLHQQLLVTLHLEDAGICMLPVQDRWAYADHHLQQGDRAGSERRHIAHAVLHGDVVARPPTLTSESPVDANPMLAPSQDLPS
jgi:hypothetical protein